jgi:drug/metabolite transporter (DMT)-like permease
MTDPTISSLAGGVIGFAVGLVAALSMAIGRGEWRRLFPRLVGGGVGGMMGGAAGGLLQAFILPEPYAFSSVLNLGTIFLVASIGSIFGLGLANRVA